MSRKSKQTIAWVVGIGALALFIWGLTWYGSRPGPLDDFAKCLTAKGLKFYGAFWCPHCQNQKATFGRSAQYLPYVECSLPDGQTQTLECTEKGIKGYPTWIFPDGSQESGEVSLSELATKSGCQLPPTQ